MLQDIMHSIQRALLQHNLIVIIGFLDDPKNKCLTMSCPDEVILSMGSALRQLKESSTVGLVEYRSTFKQVVRYWQLRFDTMNKALTFVHEEGEVELISFSNVVRRLLSKLKLKIKPDAVNKVKFVVKPGSDWFYLSVDGIPVSSPRSARGVYKTKRSRDTLISTINAVLVAESQHQPSSQGSGTRASQSSSSE